MAITITASKSGVYAEVDIITAYMGGKTDRYDTLPTLEADRELIDVFWRDARAWAVSALGAAILADTSTDDALKLTIAAEATPAAGSIEPLMRSALARYIIWRWMLICDVAEADKHLSHALTQLERLRARSATYPSARRIPPIG